MTLIEARAAIMAVVNQAVADHAGYQLAVETSNRDVIDPAAQVNPYLQISVQFMGGGQVSLGASPVVQQDGQILFCAVAKGGSGEAEALALLDFLSPYFSLLKSGSLQCHAFIATGAREIKGLWYAPAIVDFYYHRTDA